MCRKRNSVIGLAHLLFLILHLMSIAHAVVRTPWLVGWLGRKASHIREWSRRQCRGCCDLLAGGLLEKHCRVGRVGWGAVLVLYMEQCWCCSSVVGGNGGDFPTLPPATPTSRARACTSIHNMRHTLHTGVFHLHTTTPCTILTLFLLCTFRNFRVKLA